MAIDAQGNPSSYEIIINEYQRKMMIKAFITLIGYREEELHRLAGDVDSSMFDEAELFLQMLFGILADERANPGLRHGLCL